MSCVIQKIVVFGVASTLPNDGSATFKGPACNISLWANINATFLLLNLPTEVILQLLNISISHYLLSDRQRFIMSLVQKNSWKDSWETKQGRATKTIDHFREHAF